MVYFLFQVASTIRGISGKFSRKIGGAQWVKWEFFWTLDHKFQVKKKAQKILIEKRKARKCN